MRDVSPMAQIPGVAAKPPRDAAAFPGSVTVTPRIPHNHKLVHEIQEVADQLADNPSARVRADTLAIIYKIQFDSRSIKGDSPLLEHGATLQYLSGTVLPNTLITFDQITHTVVNCDMWFAPGHEQRALCYILTCPRDKATIIRRQLYMIVQTDTKLRSLVFPERDGLSHIRRPHSIIIPDPSTPLSTASPRPALVKYFQTRIPREMIDEALGKARDERDPRETLIYAVMKNIKQRVHETMDVKTRSFVDMLFRSPLVWVEGRRWRLTTPETENDEEIVRNKLYDVFPVTSVMTVHITPGFKPTLDDFLRLVGPGSFRFVADAPLPRKPSVSSARSIVSPFDVRPASDGPLSSTLPRGYMLPRSSPSPEKRSREDELEDDDAISEPKRLAYVLRPEQRMEGPDPMITDDEFQEASDFLDKMLDEMLIESVVPVTSPIAVPRPRVFKNVIPSATTRAGKWYVFFFQLLQFHVTDASFVTECPWEGYVEKTSTEEGGTIEYNDVTFASLNLTIAVDFVRSHPSDKDPRMRTVRKVAPLWRKYFAQNSLRDALEGLEESERFVVNRLWELYHV